ncbi:MAG: 5-formyltetrahydrofolate cyclo-ligase [Oscillospiraceae bacterium]|nr:5-formyltetrahydrofolate cyclo-ligase [Oscillospiraceae bacterium]
MPVNDIRLIKKDLREKSKILRRALSADEKAARDAQIAALVTALPAFAQADVLLTYIALPIEVDTAAVIRAARGAGKAVAAPRCVPGTSDMVFYFFDTEADLAPGTFGVPEPVANSAHELRDFSTGLCLVPALSYDRQGYRLGYGKGYYDRFLSNYSGVTVGLCYHDCVGELLPHGKYDRPVDLLVTEKWVKRMWE